MLATCSSPYVTKEITSHQHQFLGGVTITLNKIVKQQKQTA